MLLTTVEFRVEIVALKASGSSSANSTASRMIPPATKNTGFESE